MASLSVVTLDILPTAPLSSPLTKFEVVKPLVVTLNVICCNVGSKETTVPIASNAVPSDWYSLITSPLVKNLFKGDGSTAPYDESVK